jgi:hypothetical protein
VEGTQGPPQRLDRRDHLRILTVPPIMEKSERDDLDEVEESDGLFPSQFSQLTVQLAPDWRKLFGQTLLLIIASGIEVEAIGRT